MALKAASITAEGLAAVAPLKTRLVEYTLGA